MITNRIKNICREFEEVTFGHVCRSANKVADGLAKKGNSPRMNLIPHPRPPANTLLRFSHLIFWFF